MRQRLLIVSRRLDVTLEPTLRLVEIAEWMRTNEVRALHGQTLLPNVDPDLPESGAFHITAGDIAQLRTLACEFVESAEQLRAMVEGLGEEGDVEVRWRDLENQAAHALALGVADLERVDILTRCLSVKTGFGALAEALRCTDSHESWGDTTLADVLGRFRRSDGHFVRRVAEQAHLSPAATFADCDREQITRLANVLGRHAATERCR